MSLTKNWTVANDKVRDRLNSDPETLNAHFGQTALVYRGNFIDFFSNDARAQKHADDHNMPFNGETNLYTIGGQQYTKYLDADDQPYDKTLWFAPSKQA